MDVRRVGAILALALLAGSLGWLVAPVGSPDSLRVLPPVVEAPLRVPGAAALPPPPATVPGAQQFHDGSRWRSVFWASDELRVHVQPGTDPGTVLPGSPIEDWNGAAFTTRGASLDFDGFTRRARELQSQAGVLDVRPVFYRSATALENRQGPRLFLSTQVLATLPAGTNAAAAASRLGVRLIANLRIKADTHVFQASEPLGALGLASALLEKEGALVAIPQFTMMPRKVGIPITTVTDPNYSQQWHLKNTGQGGGLAGEDVRAEEAWDITFGAGAVIGVIDDGVQRTHPDLSANYLATSSFDFDNNDFDPSPAPHVPPSGGVDPNDDHGTAVTGVAAAVNNNAIGVTGIAPKAKFAGLRLTSLIGAPSGISDAQVAAAMSHDNDVIQIKTNSWTFSGDGALDLFDRPFTDDAINTGWTSDRGGKGVIYLFAAGNSGQTSASSTPGFNDNVNYSAFGNRRQIISVGATDNTGVHSFYSNPGAALLVCAPSDGGTLGIATTDRTGTNGYNTASGTAGNYTISSGASAFGGTSSATPLVAGVVALMLSANPNLSARDVQHILVLTARKLDGLNSSWFTNGANRKVSHLYGHGVVDAGAAVRMAKAFPYAKPEQVVSASATVGVDIPDGPGPNGVSGGVVSSTLTLPALNALRVEHVEVVFNATHESIGNLRVRLTHGPTTDLLANQRRQDTNVDYVNWQFMSTLHWGESSAGDWILQVDDLSNSKIGKFNDWTLRVYGTPIDSTAPVAGTVKDGPGVDIAAQSSGTTLSANWTGFSDPESNLVYDWAIGTTPGGTQLQPFQSAAYATSASATGLSLVSGTTYYVTVRATNFEGLQSQATSNGVLVDTDPPLAPGSASVTPSLIQTGDLHVSWTVPTDPGGSGVASYTVQRSVDGGAFSTVASVTTTSYDDVSPGEGSYRYQIQAVDGVGNVGSFSGITGTAVVDRTAPNTTITGNPPNPSGNANPTFTFSATEANCTFSYQLDGGAATSNGTSTTVTLLGLAPGSHTFQVHATDAAGNVDATPASYTWNIPRIVADSVGPFMNSFDSSLAFSNWTVTSTGAPAWAVDATPGTILGSAPAYASAPSSLNYNSGTNYQTAAVANSGTATSPLIDISGLPATGWLRFMCNYDTDTTGTATDQRIFKIMSPDLGTTRATMQFSGSGASPLGCGAAGSWHEHAIPFNVLWGTTFKLQITFDTVDGNANTGAGWFIDDLEFSDLLVAGLNQYSAGGTAPIAIGAAAGDNALEFRGLISQAATGLVKVEVEVAEVGSSFTGTATGSAQGSAGASVTIATTIAVTGNYRWRARTQTLPAGVPSGWMEFGANPSGDIDFQVTSLAGSGGGGGGGCGMTGLEWIAALGLLRMFGRRRR